MTGQVRYGKVEVECGCCVSPPVAFDSEEGRERRRRCARNYKALSTLQLPVAILALGSGATSAGLMSLHPAYPYFLCLPVVSSLLMLIAGVFGVMAGRTNMDNQIPPQVKRNVIVHYVLCLIGCTICMLTVVFSGAGLAYCRGVAEESFQEDCSPHRDLRSAFLAVDVVLGLLLFVTCIVGAVLFCRHARSLGFSNPQQRMEEEILTLQAQVAALSQAQQAQQFMGVVGPSSYPVPPPYSQVSSVSGSYGGAGTQYGFSESGFTGSSAGKSRWPAGY